MVIKGLTFPENIGNREISLGKSTKEVYIFARENIADLKPQIDLETVPNEISDYRKPKQS